MGDSESVFALLRDTGGQVEYKYPPGDLSIVSLVMVVVGTKRIRDIRICDLKCPTTHSGQRLPPLGKFSIYKHKCGLRLIATQYRTV
jgi:hypothetical protein